jgi:protocatechuate 3,4-dioxygenase alpha subunit
MPLKQTPSQTVGPFFAYGLVPEQYGYDLPSLFATSPVSPEVQGQKISVIGQVFDGDGNPVNDALLEFLQSDAEGLAIASPADITRKGMSGFCRIGTGTDKQHRFVLDTIKPGAEGANSAPHLNVIVLMRGMLMHAFTRVYFDDEPEANERDEVLQAVPAARRPTLIARLDAGRPDISQPIYRFDIHMQGEQETVFFDL